MLDVCNMLLETTSPIYGLPHEHGTVYTPFSNLGSIGSFTWSNNFLRVFGGEKETLIFPLFKILAIFSMVPLIYGRLILLVTSLSLSFSFEVLSNFHDHLIKFSIIIPIHFEHLPKVL